MNGFKYVCAILAVTIPTVGLPTAGLIYKAAHAPKEVVVYKDKIVYKEPGGKCMLSNEQGRVLSAGTETYSEPTKDNAKATRTDTRVTFAMADGKTRICNWEYVDLTPNVKEGMVFTPTGGERIM